MSLTLVLAAHAVMAILIGTIPVLLVRRAHHHCVFGVGLDMFLQILRPFEGLSTKLTSMRFQWHMDTNVGGDVIPLDDLNLTITPRTDEVKIVGTLAADMGFANMILHTTSTMAGDRDKNDEHSSSRGGGSRGLLHKVAQESQPSSHSLPIDRDKIRYCC